MEPCQKMGKCKWISPVLKQIWAMSSVMLNMVAMGMMLAFSSSLLPALSEPDSSIKTDLQTSSWIVSSIGIACMPGFIFASYCMDYFGRRMAHILGNIPAMLGWTLIYYASNVSTIIAGRLFNGVAFGACLGVEAVILGEYCSPKYRGVFLNSKTASLSVGSLLVHILGYRLSWRSIALLTLILQVVSLLITLTWPESPVWLAATKQFNRCEDAFIWLRGEHENSLTELDDLIKKYKEKTSDPVVNSSCLGKMKTFVTKVKRRDFLFPVFIVFLGNSLLEMCGRHYLPGYVLDILGKITGNKSETYICTLIVDILVTSSIIFSAILVKLMNRRTLLFSTGLAALAVLAGTCIYLLLVSRKVITNERSWIPVSMLAVYLVLVNLGCIPLSIVFYGEIIPFAHRASGLVVVGVLAAVTLHGILHMPPFLLNSIDVHGTFTVFGIMTAVILLILYFILPETKDKTLQEIEALFYRQAYSNDVPVVIKDDDVEVKTRMLEENKC